MSAALVRIALQPGADLAGFRAAARALIGEGVRPEAVAWDRSGGEDLFGGAAPSGGAALMLPKGAAELVATVVCHSHEERYGLLYALLWRLTHGEKSLLENASDKLVHRVQRLAKSVHRDLHKMHAYVRFRKLEARDSAERYIAWFEPDHWIVEATASFFVDRFRGMDWAILTPKGSLFWDRRRLAIGPAVSRSSAPDHDAFEAYWLDYYAAIFNPARLNPDVMRGHMAVKYWKNLPEAAAIPGLIRSAPQRVQAMIDQEFQSLIRRNPDKAVAAMADQAPASLDALNRQILESRPPAPFSARAVLGEGPIGAIIAFVGEQPGDQEDEAARPFVGPAGQVFDKALSQAGIDRREAYVTNAVKHFKFKLQGRRRIHQTPTSGEIKHYRWWLQRELAFVRPRLVVALGATAAQALAGKAVPVLKNRGPTALFEPCSGLITVHPSSLLRQPDEDARASAYSQFVDDLRRARALVG